MRGFTPWWSNVFIALLALIIASHFLFEHPVTAFFDWLQSISQNRPTAASLVVFGLSADILLPIPSSMLAVWGSVSLGPVAGFAAIWFGLCVSCVVGYGLGAMSNTWLLKKLFIRTQDMLDARRLSTRYGSWALVMLRAVPVLAEASVITAGLMRMPFRHFMLITSMSNAGIALIYTLVGGYAQSQASFLAALIASITIPAAAWLITRLFTRTRLRPAQQAAMDNDSIRAAFNIEFGFPVCFTTDVFEPENQTLIKLLAAQSRAGSTKVLFVVDRDVLEASPHIKGAIAAYCGHHGLNWGDSLFELPGGEAAKTGEHITALHRHMLQHELDRHSYVIAIGGGGALDAAGYAAATFHRGIRNIRLPTTVLAQNDAGIGVKSGINAYGIKNLIGSFTVPYAVINDSAFLATLPSRVFRSGFAEAVKVALIRDSEFFDWIATNANLLNRRDEQATQYLIKRCAELHLRQICHGGDPFETGNARPLDYGHWSAHKLESLSRHELLHGEAVAIGMALDALYAVETGMLNRSDADRIIGLLQQLGFELWHPTLMPAKTGGDDALLAGLEEFRQHLGGELCITLLTAIGHGVEVNTVDTAAMLAARNKLHACAGHRAGSVSGDLNEIDSVA
jgi:3-dehydroquinate synthase